jgi:hypothetical protein
MKIERFEDIEAWQLARELTLKVYRLTNAPGFTKDYGQSQRKKGSAPADPLWRKP